MIAHKKTQEKPASIMAGGFLLVLSLAGFVATAWLFFQGIATAEGDGPGELVLVYIGGAAVTLLASILILTGLYSLQQNESAAMRLRMRQRQM